MIVTRKVALETLVLLPEVSIKEVAKDLRSWLPCPLGGPARTKDLRISCCRARRLGPPDFAKDLRTLCCRALAGPRRYKGTTLLYNEYSGLLNPVPTTAMSCG